MVTWILVNTGLGYATRPPGWLVKIVSGNALMPSGNKPSITWAMMIQIYVAI